MDATSSIDIGQIGLALLPYVMAGLGAVWTSVLLPILRKHFKNLLTDNQWANIDREADIAARKIWAEAEPTISQEKITGVDPRVSFAVQEVALIVGATAKNLGLTPEALQAAIESRILAHIGHGQQIAASGPIAATIPVPVAPVVGVHF
jgi:hypothetical protein